MATIAVLPRLRTDDTDMCMWWGEPEAGSCSRKRTHYPKVIGDDGRIHPLRFANDVPIGFCEEHAAAFIATIQTQAGPYIIQNITTAPTAPEPPRRRFWHGAAG